MGKYTDWAVKKQNSINALVKEGVALAQKSTEVPSATIGVLADGIPEWKVGTLYEKQYTLFTYDGKVGFTRLANVTAMEHQPPFSTGMESVYGVRPIPNLDGVYPYIYNMKADVGMLVRSMKDNNVYECIQAADPLLYDPVDVPALFNKI